MENSKIYKLPITIRFKDCDGAGIVFYPRYFEMVIVLIENWFEDTLNLSFKDMHHKFSRGIPTVELNCQFKKPGLLGDKLSCQLKVLEIGNSSAKLDIVFLGEKDNLVRIQVQKTIVWIDLVTKKSMPWPKSIKQAMTKQLVDKK